MAKLKKTVELFEPCAFFVDTKELLSVWPKFKQNILSVCFPTMPFDFLPPEKGIAALRYDMTDAEILSEIGDGHIFTDPSDFCYILSETILEQVGGKRGMLLNNGRSNIFFVRGLGGEIFIVSVNWVSGHKLWAVRTFEFDSHIWCGGVRVLSPGKKKKPLSAA